MTHWIRIVYQFPDSACSFADLEEAEHLLRQRCQDVRKELHARYIAMLRDLTDDSSLADERIQYVMFVCDECNRFSLHSKADDGVVCFACNLKSEEE